MPWSQNRSFSVELAGAPDRIAQVHSAVADQAGVMVEGVASPGPLDRQSAQCRITVDQPGDTDWESRAGARLLRLLDIVERYAGPSSGLIVVDQCVTGHSAVLYAEVYDMGLEADVVARLAASELELRIDIALAAFAAAYDPSLDPALDVDPDDEKE
jgi:hypothetical protein